MIHFICNKDVVHNGVHYRKGQAWDGDDLPAPQVGPDWAILQEDEPADPNRGGLGASASRGFVRWKEQPARPRAASLTSEEKSLLEKNPYASLNEPVPAPPPPAEAPLLDKKKPAPVMSSNLLMTEEERDDPFGLKARAVVTTAELQAETEKEDSPVDQPDKK